MPHPLQTRADVARVVAALRTLLAALEQLPVPASKLAQAFDEFRASFGSGTSPEGVSVDSTGRPDLFGLRVLIRTSSALPAEGREALADLIDGMWESEFRMSPWIDQDGPDAFSKQRRESDAARRHSYSDAPIRTLKGTIRRALDSLQPVPDTPNLPAESVLRPVIERTANQAEPQNSLENRLAKLRSAAQAIERLAANYFSALRPVHEALQAVADVPLEERERWTKAVSALARRLRETGLGDVPESFVGVERWDRQFDAGRPGRAFAGQAFCAALAGTIANGTSPAGFFSTLDQRSFITTQAATREICAILSQLMFVHAERTAAQILGAFRAVLTEVGLSCEMLRFQLDQCGMPLSTDAALAVHHWEEFSSGVCCLQFSIRPVAEFATAQDKMEGSEEELRTTAPAVGSTAPTPVTKRSTERGEGRLKLIAALTKHHQYADGSCLNLDPIGNNELAKAAEVSPSTASAFFSSEFQGHTKYKSFCRDAGRLADALKLLNNEFSPYNLYGGRPADEGD